MKTEASSRSESHSGRIDGLSRRDFLRVSGLGAVGALGSTSLASALLAACTSTTSTVRTKSQIVFVAETAATTLDVDAFGRDGDVFIQYNQIGGLIRRKSQPGPDPNTLSLTDQFEGNLAHSWTNDTANNKIVFNIRPGLKFANGDPLTASDFKYAYDRSLKSPTSYVGPIMALLTITDPQQIVAVNDTTLELHYQKFNPFVWDLMVLGLAPLDKKAFDANATTDDAWATKWAGGHMVASGPYQVTQWDPANQVVLEPNKNYWDSQYPLNSRLTFKIVTDPSTRVLLLKNGDIDVVKGLPFRDLDSLKSSPGVKLGISPSTRLWWLGLNTKVKPFNDKRVRQAIAWAFPYDDVQKNVWYGYADPMTSFIPVGMPTHDGSGWTYTTDIAKAKSLLAEAGYPNGFDTRLISNPANVEDSGAAVWIQSGLAKAGIRVTIDKKDEAAYNAALFGTRDAPMFMYQWLSYVNDPYYHAYFLVRSGVFTNFMNYQNTQVDQLIDSGLFVTDAGQRTSISQQIQKLVADDAPMIYMAQPKTVIGLRSNVTGYAYNFDEISRFWYLNKG
jgi:peptide/nickel transport system substrate-binding protein